MVDSQDGARHDFRLIHWRIYVTSGSGFAPLGVLLVTASLLLAVDLGSAHAASSVVTLDPLPSAVYAGNLVVFSGTLTSNGVPLSGQTVWICEDDPFIPDECLVRTMTDNTGRFRTEWTAQAQAVEIDLDIYAKFNGAGSYESDQTIRYTMSVYETVGLSSATVTLSGVPSWVYAGDTVVFAGTLTSNGVPLPSRTVWICEDDPFIPDECLVHGTTDSRGQYNIAWTAKTGTIEVDFDIYAEFNGDGSYESDQTSRRTMSVYKHDGSITLDPIPKRAAFGEIIMLTGTLHLDAHNPEGSIVYIKDEDTLNPDDLLVSAYVEASGRFTTFWVVEDVDPDYTIDIQAVYEGGSLYYRQATPIQKLTAYYGTQEPVPEPGPVDGGYMELYRSLDFEQPPHVAIVPSPDSYEQVRRHIVPVQEGILELAAILEQEYPNGDWNVDFEVVQPGGSFSERPDVIMNLVTRAETSGYWNCDDWWGWADTAASKPVPTTVCSRDDRSNAEIGATAVHEFVHAIGLGHTFNIPGDLMCSVEDDVPTCPGSSPKSTVFSELNLRALASIYGTDGFQNPNNHIIRDTRFATGGSITVPSTDGTNGINTGAEQFGQYDYVYWPEDCIGYDDVAACLEYYCISYWDIDGFLSYDTCLADTPDYSADNQYQYVLWPEACYSYENMYGCLEYYCTSYWDIDDFSSYNSCLEDPFSYYNPYVDVLWPEDCSSYEYYDNCLTYYCALYWDTDGFSSYGRCLADPFAP